MLSDAWGRSNYEKVSGGGGGVLSHFLVDIKPQQGLIFAIFRKYPVPSIDNIFVFIEYVQ